MFFSLRESRSNYSDVLVVSLDNIRTFDPVGQLALVCSDYKNKGKKKERRKKNLNIYRRERGNIPFHMSDGYRRSCAPGQAKPGLVIHFQRDFSLFGVVFLFYSMAWTSSTVLKAIRKRMLFSFSSVNLVHNVVRYGGRCLKERTTDSNYL